MSLLYKTKSVCPVCLKEITADITEHEDGIYMEKCCPEHGSFCTLIWNDNAGAYERWLSGGGIRLSALPQTEEDLESRLCGRNFACEACLQPSSSALMVTNRCNMNCPVCFTRDRKEALHEPSFVECEALLRSYREQSGMDALLEFCGGEPTVREDLPELACMAKALGFDYIQLNTNGIRLAESEEYCKKLGKAGITTAYMGFDGLSDKPYYAKYGRSLLKIKQEAVKNCEKAGLAVVLVICVIPGENDSELGEIIEYAKEHIPTVKGVYLQPISYFGIYPEDKIRRITIPDIIRNLAVQHPDVSTDDFGPGTYEHPQCSFNACYMKERSGRLISLTGSVGTRSPAQSDVHSLRKKLRTWLPGPARLLTVGGMAFQDAWNIDLLRVGRCSIQILQKDGKRIPLCTKFLTGCDGKKLFPGIG